MKINIDVKKINEILTRGVVEVINKKNLTDKLISGKQLRIKFGVDPTSANIHLGRSVPILKLRDFQEMGHKIVFIIGDFTGTIGDTSDKESERPMLSKKEIKENMKTYFSQVGKILDMKKVEQEYNSKWLKKLRYSEIGEQANIFSVADFIARDNIKKRLDLGKRVSLKEMLYPIMQGYDSVSVRSDVEIGGTDQRFNMLSGRKLQQHFGQAPQDIIMVDLITGLDGRKMSSSWGNTINITDEPNDMYGKIMSMNDCNIIEYFISTTRVPINEIDKIKNGLDNGKTHPKDVKMRLAREVTMFYYGRKRAQAAEENFIKTFQKKGIPRDINSVSVNSGEKLIDIITKEGIVKSKKETRRLISSGAIKNMDKNEKINDTDFKIENSATFKIGKRQFIKINVI